MGCADCLLPQSIEFPMPRFTEPVPVDQLHWYAVYTYPRHEKTVADSLQTHSLTVYLPTILTESRWKDRTVFLQAPAFPSYVFTRIHSSQRGRVLGTSGVVRILSVNAHPVPIDDAEIEALRLCLERGSRVERCSSLEVGDRVRVRSGLLKGLVGQISRCKSDRRLIVPITLINQSVAVEVDVNLLEPMDPTAHRISPPIWRRPTSTGPTSRA